MNLFNITGESFFLPLTSKYKEIYLDIIEIVYDCYRTELSYGIEREILMQKLLSYFDSQEDKELYAEDDEENLSDSRLKASYFLRKLKACGWVDTEIGSDQKARVIMPNYAVDMMRIMEKIASGKETEYQSKIAAVYSTLNNRELLRDPYPLVIKPVYELTTDLFTALKQLNTGIRYYIETLTADKSAEEIIRNYLKYSEEIGSKAYHRLMTSDNVSRFRNSILVKLDELRGKPELQEKIAWGYQRIEGEDDSGTAEEESKKIIMAILDYYHSYDAIVEEITAKHTKYLNQTVKRAKFLLTNTNNAEGKINTILRYLAESCNRDEENSIDGDAPDELVALFSVFPQGFVSEESIMTMPISRKITEVGRILDPDSISDEERKKAETRIYEKYKNRFSRKNILAFVRNNLLEGRESCLASEIPVETKRDMIRVAFIGLFGQDSKAEYKIEMKDETISKNGFVFRNFEIRRKEK